jgi:hypothetical protein
VTNVVGSVVTQGSVNTLSGSTPVLNFDDTAQASGLRRMVIQNNSQQLQFYSATDTGGLDTIGLSVNRGGLVSIPVALDVAYGKVGSDVAAAEVDWDIDSAAGYQRDIRFLTAGGARWIVGTNNATESGANAGSNFFLNAYDDTGSYLSTPFSVARSTGVTTIASAVISAGTITAAHIDNSIVGGTTAAAGSFTTLSASSTVSGSGFSTYLASPPAIGGTAPAAGSFTALSATGNTSLGTASLAAQLNVDFDTAAAQVRNVRYLTAGALRWTTGANATAESGSNVGSDWFLNSYNDAGSYISTPLQVTRSTGVTTIASAVISAGTISAVHINSSIIGNTSPNTGGFTTLTIGSTSGPTITSGTGVPGSTTPKGSIFLRTDGGVGTTLYVSQGSGTWNAVSGV